MRKSLCFILLAAMSGSVIAQSPAPSPVNPMLGSPGGRFVFGQISDARRDQFMVDTQTGRLWQVVCVDSKAEGTSFQCNKTALAPIFYAYGGNDYNVMPHPVPTMGR